MENPNNYGDICIPNHVLESEDEFDKWYLRMKAKLFPKIQKVYVLDIQEDSFKNELRESFERIILWTNYIFYDKWEMIGYLSKTKKFNRKCTDIISIACNIVAGYYNLTLSEISKLANLSHATIIYYIKRHNNNCRYNEYLQKYNKLLIQLRNEGLISTVETV